MKPHYIYKNRNHSGRLFIPMWEWNNVSPNFLKPAQEVSDLPQWHKDLVFARYELLKRTPYTQLLDFDTAMDEIEKNL